MKSSTKRFISYIIDMGILLLVAILLKWIWPVNPYEIELSNYNEQYLNQTITQEQYHTAYISLMQKIDQQDIGFNILMTFILVLWFVIIPNLMNGQTVGQKIMKIKTVGQPLTIEQLVGRCVIVNGLGYLLLMFIILYLTNNHVYYYLINFFAFFQIIVVIIHGFMVLYKKDYLGLADVLTKTRIEEIK